MIRPTSVRQRLLLIVVIATAFTAWASGVIVYGDPLVPAPDWVPCCDTTKDIGTCQGCVMAPLGMGNQTWWFIPLPSPAYLCKNSATAPAGSQCDSSGLKPCANNVFVFVYSDQVCLTQIDQSMVVYSVPCCLPKQGDTPCPGQ
jgi:hypothetical protein